MVPGERISQFRKWCTWTLWMAQLCLEEPKVRRAEDKKRAARQGSVNWRLKPPSRTPSTSSHRLLDHQLICR